MVRAPGLPQSPPLPAALHFSHSQRLPGPCRHLRPWVCIDAPESLTEDVITSSSEAETRRQRLAQGHTVQRASGPGFPGKPTFPQGQPSLSLAALPSQAGGLSGSLQAETRKKNQCQSPLLGKECKNSRVFKSAFRSRCLSGNDSSEDRGLFPAGRLALCKTHTPNTALPGSLFGDGHTQALPIFRPRQESRRQGRGCD